MLNQCRSVATDCPSGKLFEALADVMPHLKNMSLDPVHLVIVYVRSHGNKATDGSRFLRAIMNRFNKIDENMHAGSWGPVYTGRQNEAQADVADR